MDQPDPTVTWQQWVAVPEQANQQVQAGIDRSNKMADEMPGTSIGLAVMILWKLLDAAVEKAPGPYNSIYQALKGAFSSKTKVDEHGNQ